MKKESLELLEEIPDGIGGSVSLVDVRISACFYWMR